MPDALAIPGGQWWALDRAAPGARRVDRAGRGGRDHELRGSRRSEVEGPHLLPAPRTASTTRRFVADFLAKSGPEPTEALLQSWIDNDPKIYNSDGELLAGMATGD